METFEKDLLALKTVGNQHETRMSAMESEFKDLKANASSQIIDEIERRTFRPSNLIFSGIPEPMEGSADEHQKQDLVKFGQILRELGCIKDSGEIKILRIGKQRNERPRLLKAVCPNHDTKIKILKNGKDLRNSTIHRHVYVNPYLTPIQQEEGRRLREELRARKHDGEDVVIFRRKVVRKNEIQIFTEVFTAIN